MVISDSQKKILFETYDKCTHQLIIELEAHKARIEIVMDSHDLRKELNWNVFAIEVFLNELKTFHDHHNDLHNAVKAAQNIIDNV